MVQEAIRWLVDKGLPQISEDNPNVLHLSGNSRDVLSEALKGGRTVVTHNEYILHSRTIPFNCPPIVIINGVSLTREALLRNLRHFEFCLLHDKGTLSMTGQRFFIDIDTHEVIFRLGVRGNTILNLLGEVKPSTFFL